MPTKRGQDTHPLWANPPHQVRMAERSKALRSGRSPLLWAWVRIPLLTISHFWTLCQHGSRVAQWKRAGPITQRSVDRNHALLTFFFFFSKLLKIVKVRKLANKRMGNTTTKLWKHMNQNWKSKLQLQIWAKARIQVPAYQDSWFLGFFFNFKTYASAGNRTRVTRVAGEYSTTRPPMLTPIYS